MALPCGAAGSGHQPPGAAEWLKQGQAEWNSTQDASNLPLPPAHPGALRGSRRLPLAMVTCASTSATFHGCCTRVSLQRSIAPRRGVRSNWTCFQVSFTLGLSAWIACAARLNEVGPRPKGWCLHRDTGPTCQPSFPPSRRLSGCPPISAIWWKLPRREYELSPKEEGVLRPGRLGVAVEEVRRALARLNLSGGPARAGS